MTFHFLRPLQWVAMFVCVVTLASCNSFPLRFGSSAKSTEDIPDITPQKPLLDDFFPATYVTGAKMVKGRYSNLFAPECYAIWLGPDVAAFRREKAAEAGTPIDSVFDKAITRIVEDYLVIECHMVSVFPDASVAYDAVRLRGITPYLGLGEGKRVAPSQLIVASPVRESNDGALRRFERLIYIVFPKQVSESQQPVLSPKALSAALFLDGFGASYCFEWASSTPAPPPQNPAFDASMRLLKKGYTDGYGALARVLRATE